MARYKGPKSKIARKFREPIFGPDKALEKKNYPPGVHGPNKRRMKRSEYAIQLAEKQKAKYTYGILERQFSNMFKKASSKSGITGEILLQLCEMRLDNVVFRLGISPSRRGARQLVTHRHITVNGKIVNISSNPNQKIIINNDSQVGIFTDTFDDDNVGVAINRNVHIKKAVSVGNTTRSAVDFSDAVNISNEGETGLPFNRSQLAYMIPPRVTTAQRNLLRDAYNNSATLISGAMVYVTDLAGGPKLQVWNGSAWETITSS